MIQAIQQLGNLVMTFNKDAYMDKIDVFREEYKINKIFFIILEIDDEKDVSYKGADEISGPSKEITAKLLFKHYGRNVKQNPAPITKLNPEKLLSQVDEFIIGWFEKWIKSLSEDNLNLCDEDLKFLKRVYEVLKENRDKIIEDLKAKLNFYKDSKDVFSGSVLTIVFIKHDARYFVRDFDVFRKIFLSEILLKYEKKWGTRSFGKNEQCAICHQVKEKLYGCASDIYNWYTLNNKGFAPFYDKSNAWKLFPLCEDCIAFLEIGKKFIDEKLALKFNGYVDFYLIPRFVFPEIVDKSILSLLENFKQISISKNDKDVRSLDEHSELEELLEMKVNKTVELIATKLTDTDIENTLFLNLVFYISDGRSIQILKILVDILPSRFRKLAEIIDLVSDLEVLDNQRFNLSLVLQQLYPKIKTGKSLKPNPAYLSTLEHLLYGTKINYSSLMADLAKLAQKIYRMKFTSDFKLAGYIKNFDVTLKNLSSSEVYNVLINQLLKYLDFLMHLELINKKKGKEMSDNNEFLEKYGLKSDHYTEVLKEIFETYKEFFDRPITCAVFVLGVLTQLLMNIQFGNLKSTPFFNKLNGLKLSARYIPKLVVEVQGKLREYGASYKTLEAVMSNFFLKSGKNWDVSNDEISFYFVLGMNLAYKFKKTEGDEENE